MVSDNIDNVFYYGVKVVLILVLMEYGLGQRETIRFYCSAD